MIILTNGLTDVVDEGFLKVANNFVKKIKSNKKDTIVISYERTSDLADHHLNLNKLLLNKQLKKLVSKKVKEKDTFLYIPFPAKTLATAIRIFIISVLYAKKPNVILVMKNKYNILARTLIKLSKANIIVLSNDSYEFYTDFLPNKRVKYLKTGVDTEKFIPCDSKSKQALKEKYGFDPNVPIVLHVGHLNYGRNVNELLKIDKKYRVLLITSTLTKSEQDEHLKKTLLAEKNITIFEHYIPNIQEIYQMADVYFFPTVEACHCIDVPLSCLEAASCNLPVVTTDYGEMKVFRGKEGFYFIEDFSKQNINSIIDLALINCSESVSSRNSVLEYDWKNLYEYVD